MNYTVNEALYITSCGLASLQSQIDELGIEIGKSPLLDRVYDQLLQLERDIDKQLEKAEAA